jgi:CheY-like chemotaxis protein
MDGDIAVESEYGKGSVFTLTLLQDIADGSPVKAFDEGPLLRAEPGEIGFIAPGFRVLIVDDLATNLKVAEGLFSPYQMDLTVCRSGGEAVELVRENDFDLVLMDHMMPEMDGMEAVRRIRELEGERFRTLPIIALSANAVSGMRELFLQGGFNDFLSKPIEITKLDALLGKWIPGDRRKKIERENARPSDLPERAEAPLPQIAGIDAALGLSRTGGNREAWLKALEVFRKDAREGMTTLQSALDAQDFKNFTIHIHALKSACGTIGAIILAEQAAALETAGRDANPEFLAAHLENFRQDMTDTLESLDLFLLETQTPQAEDRTPPLEEEIFNDLAMLRQAFADTDTRVIDDILVRLQARKAGGDIQDTLGKIAGHFLQVEYDEAIALIDHFLEDDGRADSSGNLTERKM